VLAVHLPLAAGTAAWAARRSDHALRVVVPGLLVGWLVWTLFEYAFHRWLLHHTARPLLRRVFWQALHKEHHGYRAMRDPDHHGVHVAVSVPAVLAVLAVTGWLATGGFAVAAVAGWTLGYCAYEALHWLFHSTDAPAGPAPLRRLWHAHAVHHLVRADSNYGFVTTFWDRRFRTHAAHRER
jgi:sterol desaturase/sphingolipid hydroxylase (fatty acid hydroxylase superfamily)